MVPTALLLLAQVKLFSSVVFWILLGGRGEGRRGMGKGEGAGGRPNQNWGGARLVSHKSVQNVIGNYFSNDTSSAEIPGEGGKGEGGKGGRYLGMDTREILNRNQIIEEEQNWFELLIFKPQLYLDSCIFSDGKKNPSSTKS